MIELNNNQLRFSFPEIHPQASLTIEFQRTLRIPDDNQTYPLPPGLGALPLAHVDDHAGSVPSEWLQRGGAVLPLFQSEAMWLNFDSATISDCHQAYPFVRSGIRKRNEFWRTSSCASWRTCCGKR